LYEHSWHVSNTISAKHEKHMYLIESFATWFGIMQSGQVR
jgi:hypothetical protein